MPTLNDIIPPRAARPTKLAPLSNLPIFLNMDGSKVLVVGNSDVIARHTELFLAAGAQVMLCAPSPSELLQDVIEDQDANLFHTLRSWTEADLTGARLAFGHFGGNADASIFAASARAKGIQVSVVDEPELSDFEFGSVVNRASVVVSISKTDGNEALAQAIKNRIETILPSSISDWAARAKQFGHMLTAHVPEASSRKRIWADFAKTAMTEPKSKIDGFFEAVSKQRTKTQNQIRTGKVTLVGAGPGDAGLLTIKAVRALQSADVILFDKLVSDDVLELARREAKRMLVGKRGGQASCKQDDINDLMIKLGKQGKNIVRLKSGDPMIFGRAGEEIAILEAAGIDVEIVPGVTAALAAASQLGVSLTHRDHAQSVKFITAHSRKGELPDLDWKSCVDERTTLMVYMGARTAPKLAEALIGKGMTPDMAVMIATGVSRETSTIAYHKLSELLTLSIDREQPVLLGIGQVFAERKAQSENEDILKAPAEGLGILTG